MCRKVDDTRSTFTCRKQIPGKPDPKRMRAQAGDDCRLGSRLQFDHAKVNRCTHAPAQDGDDALPGTCTVGVSAPAGARQAEKMNSDVQFDHFFPIFFFDAQSKTFTYNLDMCCKFRDNQLIFFLRKSAMGSMILPGGLRQARSAKFHRGRPTAMEPSSGSAVRGGMCAR